MKSKVVKLLFLFILLVIPDISRSDVTFPARLDVIEISAGVYEVQLVLPVYQGQVLRARVVWPESCGTVSGHQVGGDQFTKWEKWTVTCNQSMVGETIGVDGLLGSPINIMLTFKSLNGRAIQEILSPVNAFYEIPEPVRQVDLAVGKLTDSFSQALGTGILFLLMAVLFLKQREHITSKSLTILILTLFITIPGIALGYISIPVILSEQLLLFLIILLILSKREFAGLHHYALLVIAGILLATTMGNKVDMLNMIPADTLTISISQGFGAAAGTCIAMIFVWQLTYFIPGKWHPRILSTLGVLSLGLLTYGVSVYLTYPFPLQISESLLLTLGVTVLIGFTYRSELPHQSWQLVLLYGLLLLGGIAIVLFLDFPLSIHLSSVILLISVIWIVAWLFLGKSWLNLLPLLLIFLMGMLLGGHAKTFALNPWSAGLTHSILFTTAYAIINAFLPRLQSFRAVKYIAPAILLLMIFFHTINAVQAGFVQYQSGRILIPVISILFLISGIYFWPRHSQIRKRLGVKPRMPALSTFLILSALLLLPYFHYPILSSAYNPAEFRKEEDQRLISGLLESTYTAFNLENENLQFEALSESVDEDLMEHIYLDSRRRMQAGVLSGAQVIIQGVDVLELVPVTLEGPERVFQVSWAVIGRVSHPTHTHFRKNQYQGEVLLRKVGQKWKIGDIALQAESRKIIDRS